MSLEQLYEDAKQAAEDVSNSANDIITGASEVVTLGALRYDPSTGKWTRGSQVRAADEALGEVTGRNMQRQAMNEQKQAMLDAKEENKKLMNEERMRKFRQEKQASIFADTIRQRMEERMRQNLGMTSIDKLGA